MRYTEVCVLPARCTVVEPCWPICALCLHSVNLPTQLQGETPTCNVFFLINIPVPVLLLTLWKPSHQQSEHISVRLWSVHDQLNIIDLIFTNATQDTWSGSPKSDTNLIFPYVTLPHSIWMSLILHKRHYSASWETQMGGKKTHGGRWCGLCCYCARK